MNRVSVTGLNKTYGALKAVEGFQMSADESEILALVGPDGAGKTSIFRAVCGLITYDSGEIIVSGFNVATEFNRIKPYLGYMPQSFSLYPDLSVEENLYFYDGLFGIKRSAFSEKKKRLYEFSNLGPFYNRRAGALSGGMKQKLALCCALIHDPQVLMLDEPTTGVDPLSRRQFWDILKDLRRSGSTIVVSTPYMDEVALADRAIFIYGGKKLAEGTPAELTRMFRGRAYRINISPTYSIMQSLGQIEGLKARRFGSSVHIYIGEQAELEDYYSFLSKAGIRTEMIKPIMPELEDTFIELMGQ
jgi:ABC-2 type transport system ATP-binding protein